MGITSTAPFAIRRCRVTAFGTYVRSGLLGKLGRFTTRNDLPDVRRITDNVPLRIFAQLKHYSRTTFILGQNVSQLRSWLENRALSKDGKTDHCGTT